MDTVINLQSVFVTDLVGIAILVIILGTRGWNLPGRKDESRILLTLIIVSVLNCIADLVVSGFDGNPGAGIYSILMMGNTYLYLYNLLVGIGIINMIIKHIGRKDKGLHFIFFWVLCIVEVVMLISNFFTPVVFSIDSNNTYQRGPLYIIFVILGFALILYGYIYYIISKIKNPSLRYFPVIEFLLPILIGNVVQTQVYGISLLPVSFTIAFAAIVISMQNECIYIDKLTGVYNRYELDKILRKRYIRPNVRIVAMMLDLNGFKAINDNYSHEEGDIALVAFANILVDAIKSEGMVIRFAGDEFIIIMPKFRDVDLDEYKERIQAKVAKYNETSGKPYQLSTAIGGRIFDPGKDDLTNLVNNIDALMYEDKGTYYKTHDRRHGRRKSD